MLYLRYKNTFTNKEIFKKEKIVLLLLLLTYITSRFYM